MWCKEVSFFIFQNKMRQENMYYNNICSQWETGKCQGNETQTLNIFMYISKQTFFKKQL